MGNGLTLEVNGKILKKKISLSNNLRKYFISKYYMPSIDLKMVNFLHQFASTSIDISDGLITDLEKLINKQKLSYKLYIDDIPISQNLRKLIFQKKVAIFC